jgi:hypothetical protein
MADESSFAIEEQEETEETSSSAGPLLATLGRARSTEIVPLAFTIAPDVPPVSVTGLALSWTREAIGTFQRIRNAHIDPEFRRNLPYASLRGMMDAAMPSVSRLHRGMGLDEYALKPRQEDAQPFLFLDSPDAAEAARVMLPLLENWVVTFLGPQYLEPGGVSFDFRDELLNLARVNRLVQFEPIEDRLVPWNAGVTGTAMPPDQKRRGFQLLVDQAARCVAGHELFIGLGPMRRIVTTGPGAESVSQLITQPIELPDRGLFSLLVKLEVVTFPSLGQPLVTLEVSKRRWLSRISDRTADRNDIGGSVFSLRRPDRAISFRVRRERGPDGAYRWMPDNTYEGLKPTLELPLTRLDAEAILRGEANTSESQVVLIHRDGISQGRHRVKVGVPERDKLEAFHSIAPALKPIGLVPFDGYRKVVARHSTQHREGARTINAPTLLGAALDSLEPDTSEKPTSQSLQRLDDDGINQLLRRHFKVGLEQIQKAHLVVPENSGEKHQSVELDTLIRANADAVKRMYGSLRPQLVIFHEQGPLAETPLRIVKAVAQLLWGEAIGIVSNKLPAGVHGPKPALDGATLPDRKRSELRVEAWRPYAKQVAAMKRRTFCLVMAPDRYRNPDDPTRAQLDDRINKAAGRQALATLAQASVQYLLPPHIGRDSDQIDLIDFLHRIQAALRDLISAHSGRFEGLARAAESVFSTVSEMRDSAPREILGITVVRKQAGRRRGGVGSTYLPLAIRMDVSTGQCELRSAFEDASGQLKISQWEPFADGLSTVSRISPVRLAEKTNIARTRFARFVEEVISESVDAGANPLVLIDSTNCVQLWNWLADQRLDVGNIKIGDKEWMEKSWKGARIVRIRQDLAPGIVENKEQRFARSSVDDDRDRTTQSCDVATEAPTSPHGLFRLTAADRRDGPVCYLSVGQKTLHMIKRGVSCYRTTDAGIPYSIKRDDAKRAEHVRNRAGQRLYVLGERPPWIGQWPTPNPLEIVVTLRGPADDPDRIAELVERLRYGFGHYNDWTSLPAPLFFERVVRDYISGFTLDELSESRQSEES